MVFCDNSSSELKYRVRSQTHRPEGVFHVRANKAEIIGVRQNMSPVPDEVLTSNRFSPCFLLLPSSGAAWPIWIPLISRYFLPGSSSSGKILDEIMLEVLHLMRTEMEGCREICPNEHRPTFLSPVSGWAWPLLVRGQDPRGDRVQMF